MAEKKRMSRIISASAALLWFTISGFAIWGFVDAQHSGKVWGKHARAVVSKDSPGVDFGMATGVYMLGAALAAVMGVQATFRAFGKNADF